MKEALLKQVVHHLLSYADDPPFIVRYWDGSVEKFGRGAPQFTLILRDSHVTKILQEDIATSFCEAYVRNQIDVDGDVADVVAAAARALMKSSSGSGDAIINGYLKKFITAAARRLGRRSMNRQRQDVVQHYDLSNEFFRLWLDDSMNYSCAYFHSPADTLEQAQVQKIDHSLRKLRLQAGESLLDIGSGWGALIQRAAEQYGVQARGITLSPEQMEGSCASIAARGLESHADVRVIHYKDLVMERKQYDKIVSIGMVEHVGKAHLGEFADSVAHLLRPGGLALLHQITSPKEGTFNVWMDKYIFPGAYLPTVPEMLGHLAAHNLRVLDVENLRPHYQMTLDHWSERFERVVPQVREMFGEEFVRMWRLYLRCSSASFREGTVDIHQILVSHGTSRQVPLTRADIYRSLA